MTTPSIVVLGLPEAGKSSFIAALSHVLQFQEVETLLSLEKLADEDKYLHELRADWQSCKPFERTTGGPVHPITLHLKDKDAFKGEFFFPDIAGEEFEEQWSGREWSSEFTDAISKATGLLLFINAKNLRKPLSIVDVTNAKSALLAAVEGLDGADEDDEPVNVNVLGEDERGNDTKMSAGEAIAREVATQNEEDMPASAGNPTLWNPREADAQAKIVDTLQEVARYVDGRRWRLGIVVSAWDVVKEQAPTLTPAAWLEKECPLVWQYVTSNPDLFDWSAFGVSAQGGDPVKDADKLKAFDSQSKRVQVEFGDYLGHDLTRVLYWAMDPK